MGKRGPKPKYRTEEEREKAKSLSKQRWYQRHREEHIARVVARRNHKATAAQTMRLKRPLHARSATPGPSNLRQALHLQRSPTSDTMRTPSPVTSQVLVIENIKNRNEGGNSPSSTSSPREVQPASNAWSQSPTLESSLIEGSAIHQSRTGSDSEPEDDRDPISLQGELVSFRRKYSDLLGASTIQEVGVALHTQVMAAVGIPRAYMKIITSLTQKRTKGEQLQEDIRRYTLKTNMVDHAQFSRALVLEREVNLMVCVYGELEVLLESSFDLYIESWKNKMLNWQTTS